MLRRPSKLKNNFFLFLISFLFLFPLAGAQTPATYEAELPLFDKDRQLGDVKVSIDGEKLRSVDRDSLIHALRSYLRMP